MTSAIDSNPLKEPYGYFITHTERLEIRTIDDIKYVKKRLRNLKLYFQSLKTLGVKR